MVYSPARCGVVLKFLLALMLVAHSPFVRSQQAPTAQDVKALADEAFELYMQESKEPDTNKRDQLLRKRADAFYILSWRFGQYMAATFPAEARETPPFALALFTYAHYLELSTDIWLARERYMNVCQLIEEKLVPAGHPVPTYNEVSILRLCIRQIDRLRAAIYATGPRPTKVSILQSADQPGPAEFLHRLGPYLKGNRDEVVRAVRATDPKATFALLAALERFGGKADDVALWAPKVIEELARQRSVSFQVARLDRVSVVGLNVSATVFAQQVEAVRVINKAYKRTFGADVHEHGWPVFIVRGSMEEGDAAFLKSALSDDEALDPHYRGRSKVLHALIGPQFSLQDSEDYAEVDQALVWSMDLARAVRSHPGWLDLAFLDHDGAGVYAMRHFAWLLNVLMDRTTIVTAVPGYECARSRKAARVCLMHGGAFARFLDSRKSASSPDRTVLQAYAAQLKGRSDVTREGEIALLQEVSGQSIEALGEAFLDYVYSTPRLNTSGPSTEVQGLASVLEQQYQSGAK